MQQNLRTAHRGKITSLMEHCGKAIADEEIAEVLKDKGIGTPCDPCRNNRKFNCQRICKPTGKSL